MNLIESLNSLPHHLHKDFTGDTAGLCQLDSNYPFLSWLASEISPKSILEVGVRLGWSGISFLHGAPEATRYVGLDHEEIPGSNEKAAENIEHFCRQNCRHPEVRLVHADSQKLENLDLLGGQTFDLIFIDADHSYEGCYRDLTTFWPALAPGGSMIADDSLSEPVQSAVKRFCSEVNARNYQLAGSLRGQWVIIKPQRQPKKLHIQVNRPERTPIPHDFYGDEITLTVGTGVGDIYWVYQKFAPYFDKINFDIACVGDSPTKEESRAVAWLKCFPKVGTVREVICPFTDILGLQYPQMEDVIREWRRGNDPLFYCCNRWLEEGVRIEDIDPGAKVDFSIPLKTEPCELPFCEYTMLYVLGVAFEPNGNAVEHLKAPPFHLWDLGQYLHLLDLIYQKYNWKLPVVVIGASWDEHTYSLISRHLNARGIPTHPMFNQPPEKVMHVMKNAKFFVAYQCGLSIVAENFNVPQIVMFFPKYSEARRTWCKKENIGRVCHEATYRQTPEEIVGELRLQVG